MSVLDKYLKECNEVYHTTLDPCKFGCVRIHLIPPRKVEFGTPWAVILNGYHVLPIQTSWAILLKEFITCLNKTNGQSLTDADVIKLVNEVVDNVQKLFKKAKETDIRADLLDIVNTLKAVAYGEEPPTEIGLLTLAEYSDCMKAPHRVDLLVSAMEKDHVWNCNQHCLHCYACGERLASAVELPTKDWMTIIDKLKKACVPAVTFTGGEPTMRKDLVELVDHARWFVTRLNTNGLLLSKELCKNLYAASLDSVQVTFYSSDKEIHNKLVGGDHFDATVDGIRNALEAGLDVSVNTPLCSVNQDYAETLQFLKRLGVHYFSCSGLIPSGNALRGPSSVTRLSKEEITAVVQKAWQYCTEHELELSFTSPGWIEEHELLRMKMVVPSCGACLSNMAVAPNGQLIPCQSWLHEDGLGNLLEREFSDLWDSERCLARRRETIVAAKTCPLSKEVRS